MPKVSVIIPVYGVEKYIRQCARSLFEQTLDDIEYLFIDDCSEDRSIELLNQTIADYPNRKGWVNIHRMECNSGQAAVRKWGMENAKGEYIIHCDSDDWVELDMYEILYKTAINENADIVRCNFDRVYNNHAVTSVSIPDNKYSNNIKLLEQLFVGNDLSSLCDKLVSRSLYRKIAIYPNDNMWEDVLLCTQFIVNSNKIIYIPKSLYHYRIHKSSIVYNQSFEATLRRFYQSCSNVDKVVLYIESINKEMILGNAIDCLKRRAKNQLFPYFLKENVYQQWKNAYSEINYRLFWNPLISVKAKMVHMLVLIKLYPLLIRN